MRGLNLMKPTIIVVFQGISVTAKVAHLKYLNRKNLKAIKASQNQNSKRRNNKHYTRLRAIADKIKTENSRKSRKI